MSDQQGRLGISVESLSKSYGDVVLFEDISFSVDQGEFMVIVGPSGCGKSSLMRVIAGIEAHGPGHVYVDGVDVTDAHPGSRSLSMVFQDYALYPHMTVKRNLSFGLRARKIPRSEIELRVAETARVVGLSDQLAKRPGQLSGGQRQRVALGRAMIQEPRAFLMDEPLSNLDAALRVQMRTELLDFHRRVRGTILYVTHDQVEAMTMGDRVAVMNRGRFEQVGTPQDIYSRPQNEYVATFMGSPKMNIMRGTVTVDEQGRRIVKCDQVNWSLPTEAHSLAPGDRVAVGVRPESLLIAPSTTASSNAIKDARVDLIENLGNEMLVHVSVGTTSLVARSQPQHLRPGAVVTLTAALDKLHFFGSAGEAIWHGSGT